MDDLIATDTTCNKLITKKDLTNIAILIAIATAIGVYLICTTVLIAKDGVCYINYAKALEINPIATIRDCSDYAPLSYTPGYPFLILITHKFVDLFCDGTTILSWIYSAQSINLLCRLLALIPLYFIAKEFVTTRQSFWAIFILIIQPYSAHIGSDVLRDWPHILFLATGFLLLLYTAKYNKWWLFAFVGIISALGYIIRPMCIQLLVYGILWLIYITFKPEKNHKFNKTKIASSLILLLIGFFIIAGPYMKLRGQILPTRLQQIIENFPTKQTSIPPCNINTANLAPSNIIGAIWKLIDELNTNLMYFFTPFWLVGLCYWFSKKIKNKNFFLIISFILLNMTILIIRYCISPEISGRYIIPLTVMTFSTIPIGIKIITKLALNIFSKDNFTQRNIKKIVFIILIIGSIICIPKLLRPLRIKKTGYRLASEWIQANSNPNDIIVTIDKRITFYANHNKKGTSIEISDFLNSNIFSYLAWIKPFSNEEKTIKEGTANDPIFKVTSDNKLALLKKNITCIGHSKEKLITGCWNHVAVTYDEKGNYNFFINGCDAGSGSNYQTFIFGKIIHGVNLTTENDNAKIGNLTIFNNVLSKEEIKKSYSKSIESEKHIENIFIGFNSNVKYYIQRTDEQKIVPINMIEKWNCSLKRNSQKNKIVIYQKL